MISIIIASVNKELLEKVLTNITETIGVEFEVISVDNREGKLGLCEIYNNGVAQSQYDILCFMHEDIAIRTNNWGDIICRIFKDNPKIGLIGVAGSQYKSLAPSTWHSYKNEAPEQLNYNLIQRYKFSGKESVIEYSNPNNLELVEVACVDGLWLCSTRKAIDSYKFDQTLLKGFHGYDLDFSIGIGQLFKVAVTFEVLIEHFSEGNTNMAWLGDILRVHAKWSLILPINIGKLPETKIILFEKRGFRSVIDRMIQEGFHFNDAQKMLVQSKNSKVMSNSLFLKLYLHLFKAFLKFKT